MREKSKIDYPLSLGIQVRKITVQSLRLWPSDDYYKASGRNNKYCGETPLREKIRIRIKRIWRFKE
jgi:hypothetical protein